MLKYITIIILLQAAISGAQAAQDYLLKPNGPYSVGYQDLYWMNEKVCPDFNYTGKNAGDFSSGNTKFCHEIIIRVYYPSSAKSTVRTPYYPPFIQYEKESFKNIPGISEKEINQLNDLYSFTIKNAKIIANNKFPVIFFNPGFGVPAQAYENFITQLVSHGYIVVGINTPFVNLTGLANGHLILPASPSGYDAIVPYVLLQASDLAYVYKKIHAEQQTNTLFAAMDFTKVGAMGHSIGGRSIAYFGHQYTTLLQAALTLDTAGDPSGDSLKKFAFPFMYQIGANRKAVSAWPINFELGKNGYLVGVSPYEENVDFSYHMNFSDLSTLQYMPAFKKLADYLKQDADEKFDLRMYSHIPNETERESFGKTTYVFIKTDSTWLFYYYQYKNKVREVELFTVKDLLEDLNRLPAKLPEDLSDRDLRSVRKSLIAFKHKSGQWFGYGDGWEITNIVNQYALNFFDYYLKNENNSLACPGNIKNSYMKCGPGIG